MTGDTILTLGNITVPGYLVAKNLDGTITSPSAVTAPITSTI